METCLGSLSISMNAQNNFTEGNSGLIPEGDAARQAIDSLRGYAYQVTAAALAWLDLDKDGRLFLEVAEDYAVIANRAIEAVQVKDTETSGTVTLNTKSVQQAISDFVSLRTCNPKANVQLRYFTTSEIGIERVSSDRPGGIAGLKYWRKAASGDDVSPLRAILQSDKFPPEVRNFVRSRDDSSLRSDMLQKIHWDCGQPALPLLRRELEERLIVVGRDVFQIAASEAIRIVDILIYRVLEKSIPKISSDRVLTRADLYSVIDGATRLSVPRSTVEMMSLFSSGLMASVLAKVESSLPVTPASLSWLIDGRALPTGERMLSRQVVASRVSERMRRFGAAILIGASGLGKSSIARAVASSFPSGYIMIDFRNSDPEETRSRLNVMVSQLGDFVASTFIFDDLNHFNDPLVAPSLGRIFEALRRRDRVAIVTCYLSPSMRALCGVGLDVECVVECPYFTQEETGQLVALYGGDSKLWGEIAYASGAFGHPQLVHAFVAGVSARNWPRGELLDVVSRGLASEEIELEKENARRHLISILPENSRTLLYRLSLAIGRFDRTMALIIANANPPISRAGECLDALIGPWLETLGRGRYRVSPLAAKAGIEIFSKSEQTLIHRVIADGLVAGNAVSGTDADVIITHALLGKNELVLLKLANGILAANEHTVSLLTANLASFQLFRADVPIYPDNIFISQMLRLAQFKIIVASGDAERIRPCATALLQESEIDSNDKRRVSFRVVSLCVILGTMSIANYMQNWLDLLQEFNDICESEESVGSLVSRFDESNPFSSTTFSALFAIGSANLSTIAKLENLITKLNDIKPERRSLYLRGVAEVVPDYSTFINSPWVAERKINSLNANQAIECYLRIGNATRSWGIRSLSIQCWVARVVIFDEIIKDSDQALNVLDKAVETFGEDVLLSRARAKIYWRAQNHSRALSILREIANEVGNNNPVERAFALREAAISAANCEEWDQAEQWFLEGKKTAGLAKVPEMALMEVCLGADAAVAAFKTGGIDRGFRGLAEALRNLKNHDPILSVTAMCRHQLIRHTVLWVQSQFDKTDMQIDGLPIAIVPGCCSNPNPVPALAERPLGPLDIVWYMLATAEVSSGVDVGIAKNLYGELSGAPIPEMEIDLRKQRLAGDIKNLNASGFTSDLWSYVETAVYMRQNHEKLMMSFDILKPAHGKVPSLPFGNANSPLVTAVVKEAVYAYAIMAACARSDIALPELDAALASQFGQDISGGMLARANSKDAVPVRSSFEDAFIGAVKWFTVDGHRSPKVYCSAGIRFFQLAHRSTFQDLLISVLAKWQRAEWSRVIESEAFRLAQPRLSLPRISAALRDTNNDVRFLGNLFLAASNATGLMLPKELVAEFSALAAPGKDA